MAAQRSALEEGPRYAPLQQGFHHLGYFPFYRDIGSPFPSPVHALISNGWVQSSQPTSTTTLSSSLSGLTHAMSSLSSPRTVPIALSTVAMLLLCFWNKLLGIGVEDKTHRHRLTRRGVHLPSANCVHTPTFRMDCSFILFIRIQLISSSQHLERCAPL